MRPKVESDQYVIYQVKGCPHCGAKPVLLELEDRLLIECPEHSVCPVWIVSMKYSNEDSKLLAIEDWNKNDEYLKLGADPQKLATRGLFEINFKRFSSAQ